MGLFFSKEYVEIISAKKSTLGDVRCSATIGQEFCEFMISTQKIKPKMLKLNSDALYLI